MSRTETYTLGKFFAICGGLFGLFLGVSLLSIVEIIYYSTLRLFWIVQQFERDEPESGRSEIDVTCDGNAWNDETRLVCFDYKF